MARSSKQLPDPEESMNKLRALIKETQFQPIDFSLDSIVKMMNDGVIELNPEFQRRHQWNRKKNSRLIESFLLNVPIPPVFIISRSRIDRFDVIDGQQRLRAIQDFFGNKYRLCELDKWTELNGLNYRDLQKINLASVLGQRPLRTFELRSSNPDLVYDVFSRLNTGGIYLNSQQVRNCTFARYDLNTLIKRLGDNERFLSLIGIRTKKDKRYRNMQNCEFVLRYFAVRGDGYRKFKHLMDPFLNLEMRARSVTLTDEDIQALTQEFENTVDSIHYGLSDLAFRNPTRTGGGFMASAYDATVHAFNNMDPNVAKEHGDEFRSKYRDLWKDSDFAGLFVSGTNTPDKLALRVEYLDVMVARVINK